MDGSRFDALAKAVATRSTSRRGLLGLAGAGFAAAMLRGRPAFSRLLQGTPTPGGSPRSCTSDADCGGAPWACLGTGHGAFCFDTSSDPTHCGSRHLNCSDDGLACCSGRCTILKDNHNHCGSCANVCGAGESCCDAECANFTSSSRHCGSCGNSCTQGDCCNGVCMTTYLSQDPKNCGRCGSDCDPESPVCRLGRCSDLRSLTNCGECGNRCYGNDLCCGVGKSAECADIRRNPKHCGDCGDACKANEACCDGVCRDVKSDVNNCGFCGLVCRTGAPVDDGTPVIGPVGDLCCNGVCVDSKTDHDNCGKCGNACKQEETCCDGACVNLLTDHDNCETCGNGCNEVEVCVAGFCVKEQASTGPSKQVDLVAAAVQTTDSDLEGEWEVARSEATEDVTQLTSLSPGLAKILGQVSGLVRAVVLTLASVAEDGSVDGLVKTVLVEAETEEQAQAILTDYETETAASVEEMHEEEAELGESDEARFAEDATPDDPDFADELPGKAAFEFVYREGSVIGAQYASIADPARAMALAKGLIDRLSTGTTDGRGLAGQLAFAEGVAPVLDAWYSRLDGKSQRRLGATDDQFAAQKATDGDATDFARASQVIPTTEADTNYRLSTWAGHFKNEDKAQDWLDGTTQRLATQTADAQLISIDEANGLGDASQGVLYTLNRTDGVAVGVSLYVRVGANIVATGLSASAPQMTAGLAALFADARPLGKGAQVVIGSQLAAPSDAHPTMPRGVPVGDIFAGSPLRPAGTQAEAEPTHAIPTAVEAEPTQENPTEANPTEVAPTEVEPTTVKITPLPDLPWVTPFPGRDVSKDYQLAGGTFCFGLDVCQQFNTLTDPYAGWVPPKSKFLLYTQTLSVPAVDDGPLPQSTITADLFFFDTGAHAKQAKANWVSGFSGVQRIDTVAKGWELFGISGTQENTTFDVVAGLYASSNYFLFVQQTNFGSDIDRAAWTDLASTLAEHLRDARTGRAPNLGQPVLDPFSNAAAAATYFGNYFVVDGFYGRTSGQSDDQYAKQSERNKDVDLGFQGGFFSTNGAIAATTVRRFTSAAGEKDYFGLLTGPSRQDAIAAGFVAVPFDEVALGDSKMTVNPFFGIDQNGAPGITVSIDVPADETVIVLSLDDGVVKVAAGGTLTGEYTAAVHQGITNWIGAIDRILHQGEVEVSKKPTSPPPLSLVDDLEDLDGTCKNDPNACVM